MLFGKQETARAIRQWENAHEAQAVFDRVRRSGDAGARRSFLRFLLWVSYPYPNRRSFGAAAWSEAPKSHYRISQHVNLVLMEASYQLVRRGRLRVAQQFFWALIVATDISRQKVCGVPPKGTRRLSAEDGVNTTSRSGERE